MDIFDKKIKLVIADDHTVVRAGLRRLLSTDQTFNILAEAINGEEALRLIHELEPDIAILDIQMPKFTGIEVVKKLKAENCQTLLVMLTAFEDSQHIEDALKAGADGYLTKDVNTKELTNALLKVYDGERIFSKTVLSVVQNLNAFSNAEQFEEHIGITKREQEILNLIAQGLTSPEIAKKLNISSRTVDSHRANLIQKLGVKNTLGLVRFSISSVK